MAEPFVLRYIDETISGTLSNKFGPKSNRMEAWFPSDPNCYSKEEAKEKILYKVEGFCLKKLYNVFPIYSRNDYERKFNQVIERGYNAFSNVIEHEEYVRPAFPPGSSISVYTLKYTAIITVYLTFPTKDDAIWWKLAQE